jgi:hypothetical protein
VSGLQPHASACERTRRSARRGARGASERLAAAARRGAARRGAARPGARTSSGAASITPPERE